MSQNDSSAATLLNEIERDVAWLYVTALQAAIEAAPCADARRDQFVQRILQTTEAFNEATARVSDSDHDSDEAMDVALILGRALRYWDRACARWRTDPGHSALRVAASELIHAGEALQSALAPPPVFPDEEPEIAPHHMPSPRMAGLPNLGVSTGGSSGGIRPQAPRSSQSI